MDNLSTVTTLISNLGFPMFVSIYVLWRLEPAINRLNETIKFQTIIIAKQNGIDYEEVVRDYGVKLDEKRR